MEPFKQDKFHLNKPNDTHGVKIDTKLEFDRIRFCELLGQRAIPHLGIYGYEYQWIYPTAHFRREFQSKQELNELRQTLPRHVNDIINDGTEQGLLNSYEQIHYYILNLNARQLKQNYLIDKNQPKIRLNFAPHAYLWPNAKFGQEIKWNVLTCLFTSENGKFIHSSLRGIDENNDFGRITINTSRFYNKNNFQEVHLHLADNNSTAISPNNGAFLLNLTFPVVNFYITMCTTNNNDHQLSIFNITIVNDETMKLTRELDTCLNIQKVLTYTPTRSQVQQEERKFQIPSMYLKILEHTHQGVIKSIKNYFSYYMQRYKEAQDKEQLLKELFIILFAEADPLHVEPYITTTGEEFLKTFYKYIWFKLKSPEIEDFGKRFFFELCDNDFQIHLVKQFMNSQCQIYSELYRSHSQALQKFIPKEIDDQHEEDLAIIESQLLMARDLQQVIPQQNEKEVTQIEELKNQDAVNKLQIKINNENDNQMEIQSDFLDKFPEQVNWSESQNLQQHLESLFSGDRQQIVSTFNQLKKLLQDYICFETWKFKGSVHGIHNDFGRHSYLQTNEIGEYYHFGDEERVNFILQLQDMFSNL